MIGYDLDGVMLTDMNIDEFEGDIESFLVQRLKLPRPMFIPQGEFAIVTGRLNTDRVYTELWLYDNGIKPAYLCHGNENLKDPALYKAEEINKLNLTIFIESDRMQAIKIQTLCPNCNVQVFEDIIQQAILDIRPLMFPNSTRID